MGGAACTCEADRDVCVDCLEYEVERLRDENGRLRGAVLEFLDAWYCNQHGPKRTPEALVWVGPPRPNIKNAPGHAHSVSGVWDWDNNFYSNKPCKLCNTLAWLHEVLE